MNDIVYLNGDYLPRSEAKISVMDRGFLFADSVYEVIPIFHQRFIGIEQHLQRLDRSLKAIYMTPPLQFAQWQAIINELIKRNPSDKPHQSIYIQVTRGPQAKRDHSIPQDYQPTILATCQAAATKPVAQLAKGFSAITVEDKRRKECFIKSTALLPNILAYHQAQHQGAFEAILIRDGYAVEATSSNLFMVQAGTVITPPPSENILGGITRDIVLNIIKANHIPYQERDIQHQELNTADEIWVTSSTKEVAPIIRLNDAAVGDGNSGPVWQTVIEHYQYFKDTGSFKPQQHKKPASG